MKFGKIRNWLLVALVAGLFFASVLILVEYRGVQFFVGAGFAFLGFLLAMALMQYRRFQSPEVPVEIPPIAPPPLPLNEIIAKRPAPEMAEVSTGLDAVKYETARAIVQAFEELPIAILRIGADDRVSRCNRAARNFLGIKENESPRIDDLVCGLGRSLPVWVDSIRNTGKTSLPEVLETKRNTDVAVVQMALFDTEATPNGVILATLSDATQLQSLQAQFVQSQKMQAIGQLAGGVAHDFNNLLTAISGYCDLLLLRHERGDPDYGDLVQISQNANRAASLVGQLLAFSRKQTLQPQVLRVNDVLSELTHLLNRLVGEKVRLNTEYGKGLPDVFVDGRQLEQVIMNLVVNARDAMPEGGDVEVVSGKRVFDENQVIQKARIQAGTYVSIEVRDTGCGIRADQLNKIFEPFFSTKKVGEGTGLGLSMVYGIIKQTGGYIFAQSEMEKGTTFTILLPQYDGVTLAVEKLNIPKKKKAKALNGLAVMLVEDEAPVRAFAARALGMHGVDVTEAASAEEALEILENEDHFVDVIVSDVVMPGMDGPTWVRRALKARPDTRVIFVSGYAEETFSREHADIANAVFLPKPFSLKQLIEKVRELSH